ncbi:LANO_0D04170g1_1 [Lachancea nothofagi CBS 11611]|uniref:Biogenesis of lysosome-related organelles complex 1 subunit BLI1 n=1 Tax=Lachancea nothofagi CBS 11611 TaxID=1266666 RepID=A0A1G4JFU8_9SACH|nr:LANO_0D04170g1_1 [Lachancea nothofagi CBS 11611]
MKERILRQHVESCTDQLQGIVDFQSAQAISAFQTKTEDNFRCLDELKDKYRTNDETINEFRDLKADFNDQISKLEESIDYYENLAEEILEFLAENDVKKKLALKRQTHNMR